MTRRRFTRRHVPTGKTGAQHLLPSAGRGTPTQRAHLGSGFGTHHGGGQIAKGEPAGNELAATEIISWLSKRHELTPPA